MKIIFSIIFLMCTTFSCVMCWGSKEMQMFDLVEDIKGNFYDFLGVQQNATSAEIRRAYRRLSLKYHPDKNEGDPKAADVFRRLVSVYEVLKDEKLRERYNDVLVNGLPTWRQPVFYYRQLRKMGLIETVVLIFLLSTIGHYFVLWGSYLEMKFNIEDYMSKKTKARRKQKELANEIQEELDSLPRPRLIDVWPIALTRGTYRFIRDFPSLCRDIKDQVRQLIEDKMEEKRKKKEEEEELQRDLEEREKKKELKKKRKAEKAEKMRVEFAANASVIGDQPVVYSSGDTADIGAEEDKELKTGPWDDEDWVQLTRAMVRFPQGVSERWQRIAAKLGRTVDEVTAKAKEMRERGDMPMATTVQHSVSGLTANVLNGRVDGGITMRDSAFEVVENTVCGTSSEEEDEYESARHRRQARRRKKRKTVEPTPQAESDASEETAPPAVQNLTTPPSNEKENKIETTFSPSVSTWSQEEQHSLESAIRKFPKGTHERWDRIADYVGTRSKSDCMDRFRFLTEKLKAKSK